MPKKSKEIKAVRTPTKHQLSKWQRQKKQQRLFLIIVGVFIAVVVGISGYGYWDNAIRPYNEKALRVNDSEFSVGYFLDTMRYYAQGMGKDDLQKLISYTTEAITESELIRKAAPELGMMPKDEEIKELETRYGLGGKPAYHDLAVTTIVANTMIKEIFDKQVPQNAEQAQVQAMVVETENQATEVIKQLDSGREFSVLAREFSIEETTKNSGGDLGWIVKDMSSTVPSALAETIVPQMAFEMKAGEIKPIYDQDFVKKYGYWIYKVTERDADISARVYGILVGTKDEANKVKKELENGGDFAAAVQKYSIDENSKQNDGDLGWMQKVAISEAISGVLFSLPLNTISDPVIDSGIETKGGWWIIKVLNHESNREINPETRSLLVQEAFNEWLIKQRNTADIELLLNEDQQLWLYSHISVKNPSDT